MLTILDYGGGNLKSVVNMLDSFGVSYTLSDKPEDIKKADQLIFPGQGHFGQVMESLKIKDLIEPLRQSLLKGIPFLGICVGLQVLFDSSEEAPGVKGLGILKGNIIRFREGKIPQVGWNKINVKNNSSVLKNDFYYFVNSYYAVCSDPDVVLATAQYHITFTAAVQKGNIMATQFHPEKSGQTGYDTIKRWLDSQGEKNC